MEGVSEDTGVALPAEEEAVMAAAAVVSNVTNVEF